MIQKDPIVSRIFHVQSYPKSSYHVFILIQTTQARGQAHGDLQGCHENVLASNLMP